MMGHEPRASRGRLRACSRRFALLATIAAGSLASDTFAGTFELAWTAPGECPKAAFVQAEVARMVGRPWSELSADWRTARASVRPGARGYEVRVTFTTHSGLERTRDVVAASCTEATEAAVAILTASIALAGATPADADPLDTSTPAPGAPAPSGEATTARDGGDGGAPDGAIAGSDGTPTLPLVAARVGADIGSLAVVAPFVEIAGGLEWGHFSVQASASATGRVIGELEGTSAGAQMSLLLGGAAGCWRFTDTNPSLGGCAGVELGSLEARGIGTLDSRSGSMFWAAGLARAALDWNVGAASRVSIGATGVFPLRQLHVLARPVEVHRTPSVALRPWIGMSLRFE